jgi:hypothetical protein
MDGVAGMPPDQRQTPSPSSSAVPSTARSITRSPVVRGSASTPDNPNPFVQVIPISFVNKANLFNLITFGVFMRILVYICCLLQVQESVGGTTYFFQAPPGQESATQEQQQQQLANNARSSVVGFSSPRNIIVHVFSYSFGSHLFSQRCAYDVHSDVFGKISRTHLKEINYEQFCVDVEGETE